MSTARMKVRNHCAVESKTLLKEWKYEWKSVPEGVPPLRSPLTTNSIQNPLSFSKPPDVPKAHNTFPNCDITFKDRQCVRGCGAIVILSTKKVVISSSRFHPCCLLCLLWWEAQCSTSLRGKIQFWKPQQSNGEQTLNLLSGNGDSRLM